LDAQGNPFKVEGTLQDITIIKQTEKELRRLNEELLHQAEELALSNKELEQFAYIASHDLQEPLRMVTSFLSQLEKKYNDQLDDKARQYIHFATDGAARMRQVILDLLEFSRVSKQLSAVEQVDVQVILDEALRMNKMLIEEKKARIIQGEMPVINASKTPILQLFQNIIGNALKYSHAERNPEITIGSDASKEEWIFYVKDNGIGIDERFFEKIFVLFQRLHGKTEYSGTGIGLAICKKIVDAYGGRIWVESTEGIGSTFYFTIKKKLKTKRI
jgi:light-regulated signal transduction histidine kinase (bacteriophytochrome)